MGDYNPLHISPEFSAAGGFPIPIMHGLASLGIAGRLIQNAYGPYHNIKVRFSGPILPGQTIVVRMWKSAGFVTFEAIVKETGKPVISGAGAELVSDTEAETPSKVAPVLPRL